MGPLVYSMKAAAETSGYGRTKLYELISDGKLDARKAGKNTVIIGESLRNHLASLPKAVIRMGQRAAA